MRKKNSTNKQNQDPASKAKKEKTLKAKSSTAEHKERKAQAKEKAKAEKIARQQEKAARKAQKAKEQAKSEEISASDKSYKRRFISKPALIAYAILALAAFVIFPFTQENKIRALTCSGNYYYTASQIYSIADVSVNNLMIFNSPEKMEKRLEADPLIEEATVTREGQDINIEVKEKFIVGYYVEAKGNAHYLVTSEDERIRMESDLAMRTLVHYPLLVDLSDEVVARICDQVRDNPQYLTREVIERVAEIQPWVESYDKEMLKLILQDGNTVFTSTDSLFMMSTYNQVLQKLQGDNVCLRLDGANGSVQKISCTYMYLDPEDRANNREIPKKVVDPNYKEEDEEDNSEDKESAGDKDSENKDTEESDDQTQPETPSQPANPYGYVPELYSGIYVVNTPNGSMSIDIAAINDWEPSALDNFQHSPSTDLFRAMDSGIVYTYEAATDTFWPI